MPDYRLYRLTANGEAMTPPEEFFATSDEAALTYAVHQRCADGCEIWKADRFLASLEPQSRGIATEIRSRWRPWPFARHEGHP